MRIRRKLAEKHPSSCLSDLNSTFDLASSILYWPLYTALLCVFLITVVIFLLCVLLIVHHLVFCLISVHLARGEVFRWDTRRSTVRLRCRCRCRYRCRCRWHPREFHARRGRWILNIAIMAFVSLVWTKKSVIPATRIHWKRVHDGLKCFIGNARHVDSKEVGEGCWWIRFRHSSEAGTNRLLGCCCVSRSTAYFWFANRFSSWSLV
jgi:hypothetical protein